MHSLAIDTETTGVDLFHSCRPFLVTMYSERDGLLFWEWDVDPLTRMPIVPKADVKEIEERINGADELVFQHAKFDIRALSTIGVKWKEEWWKKTQDTLLSGHLLASGEPHNLTTMSLKYLAVDIQPYEEELHKACNQARAMARNKFPKWKLAKEGDPGLPSASGDLWKWDMWLPRAIAKAEGLRRGDCTVVNKHKEAFDVYIGRGSKWGNPFVIGKDGTREEVIAKYSRWLYDQPQLLKDIHELDGKRLGCFCKPQACHGDVLKAFLPKVSHPFWKVTSEYANADSCVTLPLWKRHQQLMEERELTPIYNMRQQLIRVIYEMEAQGITYSEDRLSELLTDFREESMTCERVCIGLSGGKLDSLPKSGTTKVMREVLFKDFGLPVLKASKKTGEPSVDKEVLEQWESLLPEKSKPGMFVRRLRKKRKRDTAISYMESYQLAGISIDKLFRRRFRRLHPSLNPTGTRTLRMSSSNPNEQNISKQEDANLRYCFGPLPGREWWSIDYENLELKLPAYEAGEQVMIDLFEKPNDPPYFGSVHLLVFDILHPELFAKHGAAVKKVFKSTWYQWTKNGNFAVQYGAVESSGTADRAYHVPGAQRKIQQRFKNIAELNRRQINFAAQHGYVLTMPDFELGSYPLQVARTSNGGIMPTVPLNYHVQGTAMWCMCRAMIRCWEYLRTLPDHFMIMQVHDELVFDFPQGGSPQSNLPIVLKLKALMEQSGADIGVPLSVGVSYHSDNWGKAEDILEAAV